MPGRCDGLPTKGENAAYLCRLCVRAIYAALRAFQNRLILLPRGDLRPHIVLSDPCRDIQGMGEYVARV